MSREYEFTIKKSVKTFEEINLKINLPFFGKYHLEYGTVYVKIDEQLRETAITINDDCITYCGSHQNFSVEIERENPHKFNYSYDFYTKKSCDETEWIKAISQILALIEEVKI